jgi:hypothetical protein
MPLRISFAIASYQRIYGEGEGAKHEMKIESRASMERKLKMNLIKVLVKMNSS